MSFQGTSVPIQDKTGTMGPLCSPGLTFVLSLITRAPHEVNTKVPAGGSDALSNLRSKP